ncbi:IS1380 family transposase [Nakamurella sp. YIM 132087]|uniref:IS1380 family transposase n=1 Tax=Nakamurella alba TaxID=2665158 RepID=A0A7K1FTP4_9ACTN|nr:IS1380 family transposase [Nakamurella alba]MTD17491.1 IS1380 family transposase [Nakamurella alba]
MSKPTSSYPHPVLERSGGSVVSHAGAATLTDVIARFGIDRALLHALTPWRKPLARHDPAKVLLAVAIGGDCLADVALLRAAPGMFGQVASDPTVSRTISALAADADKVLKQIAVVTAAVRQQVWRLAGPRSPLSDASGDRPVILDVDATLVTAHSDKESAAPTFKHGYGFHPLTVFLDHQDGAGGEPLAMLLRPGNAGSNTAADHITVIGQALQQLSTGHRPGRAVLVRTDAAGCTHAVVDWLTRRRVGYSLGFSLNEGHVERIRALPDAAWTPAYDGDGRPRDGAWVADATAVLDLTSWPEGLRVIVRAERPHPGAQLTFTDLHGHRLTAFATNTRRGQLAALELRHRRRARCEDRIRNAKDTGLRNLPLHGFDQNRIWLAIVMLALDLTAWLQLTALAGTEAATWEPKRLRLRLFSVAGRIIRHARRTRLRIPATAPWGHLITHVRDHLAPT